MRIWTRLAALLPWLAGSAAVPVDESAATGARGAAWEATYEARAHWYEQRFGALPSDILKPLHLWSVWPGGGFFVIEARRFAPDTWVYTTFGLSNVDMPTGIAADVGEVTRDELGRTKSVSATLTARPRADVPDRAAGYGYEVVVLTRAPAEWATGLVSWAANAELSHDIGLLERVRRYDGITIESANVGDDEPVHVLFATARPPLPAGVDLPNGHMQVIVATVITEDEMRWSFEHGRGALLERLLASDVGQYSVRGRRSVVRSAAKSYD